MIPFSGFFTHPRRGSVLVLLLLVSLSAVGTAACGRTASGSGGVDIGISVLTEKKVGPATVEVTIRTPEGKLEEGARVQVVGDMNHAGMKPVLAEAAPAGEGRYRTRDFQFTMGGDWIITARVTLPGGEKVERTVNVPGVAR